MKKEIVHKKGIDLVVVPCWWSGDKESLAASISFERPDLYFKNYVEPIPLNPPQEFFEGNEIPDVGELMYASFPSDPHFLSSANWWVGEKYDGIRCCWHPERQILYSRTGRSFSLPNNIFSKIPFSFLDSEVWFGRGQYSLSHFFLRADESYVPWDTFRIITFDNAQRESESTPFESRYESILDCISRHHPFLIVAPRLKFINERKLNKLVEGIIQEGGEGVILREAESFYEHGRSSSLIKLKTTQGDREGIVEAIGPNNEITVRLADSSVHTIASQNVQVTQGVRVGEVVTVSYEKNVKRENLLSAFITRVRVDVEWEDVLRNYYKDKNRHLNEYSAIGNSTTQPVGYWSQANMRLFLENFAKKRKLDPLVAETWYGIPHEEIYKEKSGRVILLKMRGYYNALQKLFPEIHFDNASFLIPSWKSMDERRKFFEDFAKERKMDPLIPKNWYITPKDEIYSRKEASRVLYHHGDSVSRALLDLFPEIGLDKAKLYPQSKKKFLEKYAREKGFDPLIADNWYRQSRASIINLKGAETILSKHVSKALLESFPNIGLDKSKFQWSQNSWSDIKSRRKFFENYAKKENFDALNPACWYSQSKEKIISYKGGFQVISYYKNSVWRAIMELFPEINFDKYKFMTAWHDKENRRKFFENYASNEGFNPLVPENWYKHSRENILSTKGAKRVIYYHSNSIAQALVDLFPEIGLNVENFPKWTWHSYSARKEFFEKFAEENNFDPLIAENWYTVSRKQIMNKKGAASIIEYYEYKVTNALLDCFPNIGLDPSKFSWNLPSWKDPENRRKFFEDFAKAHHFDPLLLDNWRNQREDFMSIKGASSVLSYHNGSITKALVDLFSLSANISLSNSMWSQENNRRLFFEKFAEENNFDPLIASNWYTQRRVDIVSRKGAKSVLSYHGGSVSRSLIELFPLVPFQESLFPWNKISWNQESARRKLFEDYANDNHFDALIATNWYSQPAEKILNLKGVYSVLKFHKNNIGQALKDLFPEMAIDMHSFNTPKVSSLENSRNFFENFAKLHRFDPHNPDNWYCQQKRDIMAMKGSWNVVAYHKSLVKALCDCFPNIGLASPKLSKSWK